MSERRSAYQSPCCRERYRKCAQDPSVSGKEQSWGGARGSDFAGAGNKRNTVDLALPPRIPTSVQGNEPMLEQHRVKFAILS